MTSIDPKIISICKEKLVSTKEELLVRLYESRAEYNDRDKSGVGGDEADQTMDILAEQQFLSTQQRLRQQILEIETALGKIERGVFGICEETNEYIEVERLMALPWTRLSIEGAEIRESLNKRFAR